jgi:hypothetical protein
MSQIAQINADRKYILIDLRKSASSAFHSSFHCSRLKPAAIAERPLSNFSQDDQQKDDEQNQPKSTAGVVPPPRAVWPRGQHSEDEQNNDDDEDETGCRTHAAQDSTGARKPQRQIGFRFLTMISPGMNRALIQRGSGTLTAAAAATAPMSIRPWP